MQEIINALEPLQIAVITFAVMGATELVKRLYAKDYQASVIIVVSFLVGTLMSLPLGAAWYLGGILGLAASGLITLTQNIGKKSS